MSRVLLVDWLGRGGIAQTTGAWAETLTAGGHDVIVATRPGRELDGLAAKVVHPPPSRGGRFGAHAALAQAAAGVVADWRPDLVVVQNFVVAPLERPLYRAVARAGSRVVHVIHDHRLHSPLAGTRAGLRSALRRADEVWAHTEFVARAVAAYAGRRTRAVPLPVPPALGRGPLAPRSPDEGARRTAVHFGVLKRGYKGTDRVLALAKAGVEGWRFHVLGVGAPIDAPGLDASPGFVDHAELTAAVAEADATLLPYRLASQSGAITLAQALGAVPVASAVGGIPEQVSDGVDGLLLPAGADLAAWREALHRLSRDPDATAAMARAGAERVWREHHAFQAAVSALAGPGQCADGPAGPGPSGSAPEGP